MAAKIRLSITGVAFEYAEKEWKFEGREGVKRTLIVLTDDTFDKVECRVDENWILDAKGAAARKARVTVEVDVPLAELRADVASIEPARQDSRSATVEFAEV